MSGRGGPADPGPDAEEPRETGTPDEQRSPEDREDEERFVEGLAVRGEVAPEGTDPLPPGVTHEVVEEKDGVPGTVRRRRFSARG